MNPVQPGMSPRAPLPMWYQKYFTAVLEADERKALVQIERAGAAILDRLAQLRYVAPHNPQELQDLDSALTYLRLLSENIGDDARAAHESRWHGIGIAS